MKKILLFICVGLILTALPGCVGENDMAIYHITNVVELQAMSAHLADDCILDNDIDASATVGWNGGLGFDPVGIFTGSFDGQSHKITNLYINRPAESGIGLFYVINTAGEIKNVGLESCNITGLGSVGALAGVLTAGSVSGCYSTGTVTGNHTNVGGLIGDVDIGGAVLSQCYSTCTVGGYQDDTGGLIGDNIGGASLSQCYAQGDVEGGDDVGGLVGANNQNITNCYAQGDVEGGDDVGGLVGHHGAGTIDKCYSTGAITGNTNVGGLVGGNYGGTITNSFWDTETSGQAASAGGTGRTTAQMNTKSTFTDAGWDFDAVWSICDPPQPSYPWLQWENVQCQGVIISLIG